MNGYSLYVLTMMSMSLHHAPTAYAISTILLCVLRVHDSWGMKRDASLLDSCICVNPHNLWPADVLLT